MNSNNPVYSSVAGVLFNKDQTTLMQCPAGKPGSYTIPNSVTNIGWEAFATCGGLTGVTLPESIISIGGFAFSGCGGLTNITIPRNVTSIGFCAFGGTGELGFYGCASLTAITVDTNNPAYCSVAGVLFNKDQTSLIQCPGGKAGSYVIPNSVTSIGGYAFGYCSGLHQAYFQGNAPLAYGGAGSADSTVFSGSTGTVYYMPGTTGWGSTFGGWPTVLWNPQMQTTNASFGVRTNRFGFNLTASTNIPVVVETCTNLGGIWTPLFTGTVTNGSTYFSDPQWTNYPKRFYRVRSP